MVESFLIILIESYPNSRIFSLLQHIGTRLGAPNVLPYQSFLERYQRSQENSESSSFQEELDSSFILGNFVLHVLQYSFITLAHFKNL
jgi:hypothetical protein